MIARISNEEQHFNTKTFDEYLHDRWDSDNQDVTTHIENCPQCQRRIENMVKDNWAWEDIGVLLRERANEHASVPTPEGYTSFDHESSTKSFAFLDVSDAGDSVGKFDRYEIKEILGRGGMGIVMRAFDTSLQRQCAVKVLSPELATSAAARKRFSREARSAAAVVHSHVVPIQTVDEHNGLPYLVMPVVEGRSLQERIDTEGPMSAIEAVRVASQIAEGLAAAHAQGLVHRDIKPANILLENSVERVQITDFGLARAIDDASMTRSGVIAGTPQYMSPEQAHGDAIDHRSDLFSLGSVMYFTLTGRSPFRAETTMGVLNRIGNDEPRSICGVQPDTPDWLNAIVMRLLNKAPNDRFQNASDVADLLKAWQAHLSAPTTVPAPPTESPSPAGSHVRSHGFDLTRKWPWILATCFAGFLAWAATIIIIQNDHGTLRIESNADTDVPIVIRKDNQIVDELTVTGDGTSVNVRSGAYLIEIASDVDEYEIQNNSVVIKRGKTEVAKITVTEATSAKTRPSEEITQSNAQSDPPSNEPPKISPFTQMSFDDGKVLVRFDSKAYELVSVNHFPIEDLVQHTQEHYGPKWKKRLSEDLVEVLWTLDDFPGDTVDLQLKDLETGEVMEFDKAEMTRENRNLLYRSNEHNQPGANSNRTANGLPRSASGSQSQFPMHWGGGPRGYQVLVDETVKYGGNFSASLERTSRNNQPMFGTIVQAIKAKNYCGQRIRFSGYLKTSDAEAAGLWMRIDSAERGTVGFDNMQSRRVAGTHDWHEVEIILDVPDDASVITFGAILTGDGRLWVDDLSIAVVDDQTPPTRPLMNPMQQRIQRADGLSDAPQNMNFEATSLR
ncbi:serine/threonine-protein kinase [Rhodopirellula sp. SWK7]|uniref:serine/threonine-protein kinase n=1 Tax=Rhodopirellula sp. SWK7 TaxID=595460 RepID=UPI0002BFF52A|nr:serine/threonine-protein kinase [Rhodopirellula sp. SWK7]EMI41522.1 serine/threonine protein kinase [Rhodopirellula sp. SWK7]